MKVALMCCGRLENRYAVEFIEYYKQLGFDHIYIGDNNHDGEEYFEDVLQNYINENFVTILNYRNIECIQCNFYDEVYNKLSNKYDWIFMCDFDEYLTLTKDKNIKEYLSRDCFQKVNQILINWKIYTDNDLVYDDGRPCLERFTTQTYFNDNQWDENRVVKSIIRTNIKNIHLHNGPHLFFNNILNKTTCNNVGILVKIDYEQNINYDLAYIKHFLTKTIDEWINNKCKRGVGDRNLETFYKTYSIERFFKYNKITKEKLNYLKKQNINYAN